MLIQEQTEGAVAALWHSLSWHAPARRSSVATHTLQKNLMRLDSHLVVVPPNRARDPMPHRRADCALAGWQRATKKRSRLLVTVQIAVRMAASRQLVGTGAFSSSTRGGSKSAVQLVSGRGDEALEFVEPVLHQDDLSGWFPP